MATIEETPEENIGKTLNIYRQLAIAMNLFPKERKASIKDLAELTKVHYNTAKKALLFFHQLNSVIPKFEIEDVGFKVVSKPDAMEAVEGIFESLEMRVLTKMMLLRAIDSDKAQKLEDVLTEEEKNILPKLIERGYVNSIEGRYFLSPRGRSLGSMGLSRIVKLNIPLPWENQAGPPTPKMPSWAITMRLPKTEPELVLPRCFALGKESYSSFLKVEIKHLQIRRERKSKYGNF